MRQRHDKTSLLDSLAAYRLALEFLPRRDLWFNAVASRRDGTSADAIFKVFEAVRTEYLARIGDLAEGTCVAAEWPNCLPDVSFQDQQVAIAMIVSSLPQASLWRNAIARRDAGSSPQGVIDGLDAIRRMFHAYIGRLDRILSDATLQKLTS